MIILQETGFVWMALAENQRDDQEKAKACEPRRITVPARPPSKTESVGLRQAA